MSKVRVYELAREAGMKSADLVERLTVLGYAVRTASATLDEAIADEIRRKVLGSAVAEANEQPILHKTVQQVVRPRTTVVRRRREETPAEAYEEPVVAPPAEEEDAVPSVVPVEARDVTETAEQTLEQPEPEARQESVEVATAAEVVAEAPPPVSEMPADGVQVQPESVAEEAVAVAAPVAAPEAPKEKMVRIIKRGVFVPQAAPVERKPRVAGGDKAAPAAARTATTPAAAAADKDAKKGKRTVRIGEDANERLRRGQRSGRRDRAGDFLRDDGEFERGQRRRGKRGKDRYAQEEPIAETKAIKKRIRIHETVTVGDLARRMGIKVGELITKLFGLGVMATVNQAIDYDTALVLGAEFGYEVEQAQTEEDEVLQIEEQEQGGENLPRPPVVTVMGHVDHGKTSILDAIRKTDVAAGEAGGITQHIGAYHVRSAAGEVVFLDTPGHAAFTEMRARGAKVTDIVVLVVAADDGVMDQTREAINHARAAEVPIVVAVNKIDKDNADPDRVKRELSDMGLLPEDWGGQTLFCHTSAKKNVGIDELLETIHLQAEMLELKAAPQRKARGWVIEARLHQGRGALATILVQEGTLRAGDHFVVGQHYGKVRALINDHGEQVQQAGPSMPVEVQGLSGVPQAGDEFVVVTDEKLARNVSASRKLKAREVELATATHISLDNLFEKMAESETKELKVVLRADVQGTLEAFGQAAQKLSTEAIRVRVLHEGTGGITENDVQLAAASEAIIIGFNVRPPAKVVELAEREGVDIRSYDVIYHALEDIQKAMTGMLEPVFQERALGTAEVRQTFHISKVGTIAGCLVTAGKVERNARVRVVRDGTVVFTGKILSLKRVKDDAREVLTGFECGISIERFNDIKVGDLLEVYAIDEIAATL
ncbi:MAG: translation initiation factor IF-2 [Desulfobulbaceae bacterium A2]|nr:MAG: translation initiation factor IF-2 [Desulfobulbaceae bacterium A2]